jgi:hypothetical protein
VILESDKLMVIQTLGGRMAYLGCSVLHAAIAPNHHSTGHSGTTAWKGPPLFHLGCGSGPSSWTLGLPATSVPHFAYLVASRTPLRRCLLPPTGLCAWRYMGQVWPCPPSHSLNLAFRAHARLCITFLLLFHLQLGVVCPDSRLHSKMLIRSLKIPPASALSLLFLGFLGWQLCQGPTHEETPVGTAPTPAEKNDAPPEKKAPRIAIMTFVAEERSYHHISLQNKDREYRASSLGHGYERF